MSNALVFLEACTVCGRVQKACLGRRSRRRTPLVCASCARPWIVWECAECAAVNHEQVDTLPRRGAHSGVCSGCAAEVDKTIWRRSSLEEASAHSEKPPAVRQRR